MTSKNSKTIRKPRRRKQEELHKLYEITRAISSTLDLRTVLQLIMRHTNQVFKARAGSIMLINDQGYLTIEVAQGLSEEIIANTRVRLGEGIAGWVAMTGEPLLLEGKVKDPRFKSLVERKDSIKSSLCVPLKTKENIIGVLMLRRPRSAAKFTDSQLRFLSVIADQAAIAVENARLYRQEKTRVAQMIELNKILSYEKMKVEGIISSMADPLVVTGLSDEIIAVNPAAERLFGLDKSLLIGRSSQSLFSGLGLEGIRKTAGGGKVSFAEIRMNKPAELFFKVVATPMLDREGKVQGLIFLWQDITELKRVAMMKSEIVSMVTHDLKTPLTSIQGFLELILKRDLTQEKKDQYLSIIKEESDRLVRLISNLLDLSSLETGAFKMNRQPVDLVRLIQATLSTLVFSKSKIHVVFHPPSGTAKVLADEDLIIQVLNNLLSNAIKYSPDGGEIRIGINRSGDFLEVEVQDQGIGIPEEKSYRLFDRFYRVNSKASAGIPGTGLGLANVKYIIEAHGGSLRVKSREGKGSVFTVSLPAVEAMKGKTIV